jgi:hypothetical protein
MSLASDYAATQATAAADLVNANASAPPSFVGPNGRAEVTNTGNLRVIPTTQGNLEIPPAAALALAQWITDTFS